MIVPAPYESQDWFPVFDQFMTKVYPNWREYYKCTSAKNKEIKRLEEYVRPELTGLPEEYLIFLRKIGGQGLFLNRWPMLYPLEQAVLLQGEPIWLEIGTYDYYDQSMFLGYCFPREGKPCLAIRDEGEKPIIVTDSLGRLLCNLAFLVEGKEQFSVSYPMNLVHHMPAPSSRPCPEAEEYYRTHSTEGLSERDLENIGFRIQTGKLEEVMEKLGYQRMWFSTELDRIWVRENACCILSRNFDPDDMFDTVDVSLWGMSREALWPAAERFKSLGYGNNLEMGESFT